jgi:hypothetical protein
MEAVCYSETSANFNQSICHRVPEYSIFLAYSRDSSVGIAKVDGLDGLSSIPGRGNGLISNVQCPDRLWGSPGLLSAYPHRDKAAGT